MDIDASIARQVMDLLLVCFTIESCDSCWNNDGRAWEVDGSTQALVGLGLAMPLVLSIIIIFNPRVPFLNLSIIVNLKIV